VLRNPVSKVAFKFIPRRYMTVAQIAGINAAKMVGFTS
jgi:hypothetical protein